VLSEVCRIAWIADSPTSVTHIESRPQPPAGFLEIESPPTIGSASSRAMVRRACCRILSSRSEDGLTALCAHVAARSGGNDHTMVYGISLLAFNPRSSRLAAGMDKGTLFLRVPSRNLRAPTCSARSCPGRRQWWTTAEKLQIVEESLASFDFIPISVDCKGKAGSQTQLQRN
jgi:hypothetical protein